MNNNANKSLIAIPAILLVAFGIALAGSQGGVWIFGLPLFALCVAVAFLIQWIAFIPAYLGKTESFFDLTGSLTYILVVILAFFLGESNQRALLILLMVVVWAVRLGSFLFLRIRAAGEDRRFREIKKSFSRFLLTWTIQGLWVTFSLAAALAAITAKRTVDLGEFALIGFLIWLSGFGIEVIADWQKSKFKSDPSNEGNFIRTGLWSWSRHPNYFGEIMLWVGVAIVAMPVLSGWQWITMISPIFVTLLLTRISGIPLLEARADEKWGGQEDYEAYKAKTSVLVPMPPKK